VRRRSASGRQGSALSPGRELAARDADAYREAKAILCELVKRVRRRSDQPTGILGFGVPRGDA
jgi:hypothetical protein